MRSPGEPSAAWQLMRARAQRVLWRVPPRTTSSDHVAASGVPPSKSGTSSQSSSTVVGARIGGPEGAGTRAPVALKPHAQAAGGMSDGWRMREPHAHAINFYKSDDCVAAA